MIVDTTSLSVMVQSIGVPHKDGDKVRTCFIPHATLLPHILHGCVSLLHSLLSYEVTGTTEHCRGYWSTCISSLTNLFPSPPPPPPLLDHQVRVQYYSGPEDTIMTGDSFMCKWLLRTENAVSRGARYEVFKQVRTLMKDRESH